MPRKSVVKHGTPRGYRKHLKDPTWGEPCAECRAAQAKEIQDYRERRGRDRSQDRMRATARRRALTRLVEEYPENVGRFNTLLNEEIEKMGGSK